MPSQASIDIASIFDDVITKNLKYCCICLRTEEERKLVHPEYFIKCMHIMKVQIPLVTTVCYVCEAESTRAYALFQAINFASIINRWFKDMASKVQYRVDMADYLDRHISKQRRFVGKWPLPEWWRRVRARSDLVQTEVLVVGGTAMEHADRDVPQCALRPLHAPTTTPGLDSIVIIDDDDDPLDVPAPPPPLTPAPLPTTATTTIGGYEGYLNSSSTNKILPHNIIPQTKDNFSGYILQPLMIGPDGNYHILRSDESIKNEKQDEVLDSCRILEVGPLECSTSDFDEAMQKINVSGVQTLSEPVVLDLEDGPKERGGVEKRPVMSGRIDWEDKIPMDVISFVDASDPMIQSDPSAPRKRYKNGDLD